MVCDRARMCRAKSLLRMARMEMTNHSREAIFLEQIPMVKGGPLALNTPAGTSVFLTLILGCGSHSTGEDEEDSDSLDGGPVAFDDTLGPDDGSFKVNVGDKLLVQDCTDLEWYKARVTQVVSGQIRVHFTRWSSVWDEWIEIDSPRLKSWSAANVRAKVESAAGESSRTKESWMCTADMRGFDHGSRNIGLRVRIRDRCPPVIPSL